MTSQIRKNILLVILIIASAFVLGIGCPFYHFLGIYCPGCGITRMFISIFQLNFYQAFRYNCLVFIYLIGFIIYYLIKICVRKVYKKRIEIPNIILYILIFIALLFGILRNIEMFNWLAPTIIK